MLKQIWQLLLSIKEIIAIVLSIAFLVTSLVAFYQENKSVPLGEIELFNLPFILLMVSAGVFYSVGVWLACRKTKVVSQCEKRIKDLQSKHEEEKWKIKERRGEVEMVREQLGGKYFQYKGILFPIKVASQYWTFVDIEDAFSLGWEPICPKCKNFLEEYDHCSYSDYKCIHCEFEVEDAPVKETLHRAAERQMCVQIENYTENKKNQKSVETPPH